MIDTGATSEIALSEPVAQRLGLLTGRPMSVGRSVSLGGLGQDRVVHAAEAEFAGRRLTDVEVQVFTPSAPAPLPDGLLGVGILKHYRVGLDLSAGVLWLTGPAAARPAHRPGAHAVLGG
jgi:predicted aspartyl protease